MKLLLDTHALIWFFENSPKMPEKIFHVISSPTHQKYVCAISLWEIAIKTSIDKLSMKLTFEQLLRDIASSDLTVLHIFNEHLKGVTKLPPIHKDPFDRLIVAAAMAEGMTIVTADENIHKYDVLSIW